MASWGTDENPIVLDVDKTFNDIFYANKGVKIISDYRLKDDIDKSNFLGSDGTVIGIESGSGFDPDALAPIPRIVSKKVDEQSNASGKLTINVTVKARWRFNNLQNLQYEKTKTTSATSAYSLALANDMLHGSEGADSRILVRW